MNQKNSLGVDKCFKDIADPIKLFEEWFNEAKKTEINDPNALALATADKSGTPSVRMVLLKSFNNKGFVFYTNFNSKKSKDLKENPGASLCFHWKSLLRQIRISGNVSKVLDKEADAYYKTRSYGSRIGAWASLCVNAKLGDEAFSLLDLLRAELLGESTCRLTSDFVLYWKEHTWNESNEGKLKVLYMMLCVSMDRILKKPDGAVALNLTPSKLNPKTLTGVYRKFLA